MPKTFQRDRFFWVVATQTAIVNFYLGGFGPAQSLLRADQGTSLTIAGLHGTAMGVASIAAGYANPHLAHKFGRAKSQWIGLGIFLFGLLLFVISPPVFLTIPATLIAGFGTSMVINTMLSSMSHHYGKANRCNSICLRDSNLCSFSIMVRHGREHRVNNHRCSKTGN